MYTSSVILFNLKSCTCIVFHDHSLDIHSFTDKEFLLVSNIYVLIIYLRLRKKILIVKNNHKKNTSLI